MRRHDRTSSVRELVDNFETPMQRMKLANEKLERDRGELARENAQLKDTIRKLRLELGDLKRQQEKQEKICNRSISKAQDMYAACAQLAQRNITLQSEKERTDVQRRDLLRKTIDNSQKEEVMSKSIAKLSLACAQHKISDQIIVDRAINAERTVEELKRRIIKLESENKQLKERMIEAKKECEVATTERKRFERSSALHQHALTEKVRQQEDSLHQQMLTMKRTEREKAATEALIADMEMRCRELGFSQKQFIQNIHECNEALRKEREASAEKDKTIRELNRKIEDLKKEVARKNEETRGYEQKMQRLMSISYNESVRRERANNPNTKYEQLRVKYRDVEEQNSMLVEENSFLTEHNRVLKSQLRAQSATRVEQLEKQVKSLKGENQTLKEQLYQTLPDDKENGN